MNAQLISGEAADPASPLAPSLVSMEGDKTEPAGLSGQPAPSNPRPMLTPQEKDELKECERIIEDGLEKGLALAAALSIIDGKRLYRETHKTFAGYIEDVWGLKVRQAYRLMAHHETLRAINGIDPNRNDPDHFVITAPESHTRPFYSLPLETRGPAWQEAVETAPKGVLTAKHANRVASEWKVRLGLAKEPAATEEPEGVRSSTPAKPASEEHGETLERVDWLLARIGTPDSVEAAEVKLDLEKWRDRLVELERMHSGRTA